DNIFGVEGDVASKVSVALKATLTPRETRAVASAPTTNPEAYTLFLKAKYQIDQFYQGNAQPEHAVQAIAYLQQAVQHDPQFALAYALQAKMQIALVINQMRDTPQLRDSAWSNVHKALALEPDLAEAHKVLGVILISRGEVVQGQAQLQIAQRLAPNDSRIPELLAENATYQGNWTQAAVEIVQALRLDPRNTHHYQWASRIDMVLRRYDAAIRMAQQGVAINPQDTATRLQLANALMSTGQLQAAGEQFMVVANQIPIGKLSLGVYYLFIRDYAAALKAAQAMPADTRIAYSYVGIRELVLAQAHLGLGQQAQGQALLDQAHDLVTAALRTHPNADSLYNTLAMIEMLRGHRDAALQAVDKAYALVSSATSLGAASPSDYVESKAEVLAHFGDAPAATALLNKLMETPETGAAISSALLRLDPAWDPIRHDPRFQALLKKYADATPAPEASSGG
ncbi:MAG: tetratricopeptide repeat protein, partial [Gammaproteobacteria bacterium]